MITPQDQTTADRLAAELDAVELTFIDIQPQEMPPRDVAMPSELAAHPRIPTLNADGLEFTQAGTRDRLMELASIARLQAEGLAE